jgi:hypothetical protein
MGALWRALQSLQSAFYMIKSKYILVLASISAKPLRIGLRNGKTRWTALANLRAHSQLKNGGGGGSTGESRTTLAKPTASRVADPPRRGKWSLTASMSPARGAKVPSSGWLWATFSRVLRSWSAADHSPRVATPRSRWAASLAVAPAEPGLLLGCEGSPLGPPLLGGPEAAWASSLAPAGLSSFEAGLGRSSFGPAGPAGPFFPLLMAPGWPSLRSSPSRAQRHGAPKARR